VLPEQFAPERIVRDDVQGLLRRVEVRPAEDLSRRFPAEHACRVRINPHDGQVRTCIGSPHTMQLGTVMRPTGARRRMAR